MLHREIIRMNKKRVWKDVVGYEGSYRVSSDGKIRSLDRKVKTKFGYKTLSGKILSLDSTGKYLIARLSKDNVKTGYLVHNIVAEAFLGPKPKGKETRHKDSNSTNNSYTNLSYSSHTRNEKDKILAGTLLFGEDASPAKLSSDQVRRIRLKKAKLDISDAELAAKYNVSRTTIGYIVKDDTFSYYKLSNMIKLLEKNNKKLEASELRAKLEYIAPELWLTWLKNNHPSKYNRLTIT